MCAFVVQGLLPALGGLITADGSMINACFGFSEKTPVVADCYSQTRREGSRWQVSGRRMWLSQLKQEIYY